MSMGLAERLSGHVRAKYASAQAAEALTLASSELAVVSICGLPYQLRFCPSLAKKPNAKHETPDAPTTTQTKVDPFDDPDPQLHIVDVPTTNSSHLLVLNKYPIIPNHFIIATKPNKPQTHVLEQDDLWLTYSLLKEWQSHNDQSDDKLFAFFNSGHESGASQPHRHLQLLPVADIRHGEAGRQWDLLTDLLVKSDARGTDEAAGPTQNQLIPIGSTQLPYRAFGARLNLNLTPDHLYQIYDLLLKTCCVVAESYARNNPGEFPLHATDNGDVPISYNLALTTSSILLAPRRSAGRMVVRDDGSELDFVALNGTILAGTLMVKSEEVFRLLQSNPRELTEVVSAIGIPHPETNL